MNIGVVGVGRKRPGFDQEWNALMRQRCLGALQALGFTAVGADAPVVDDQTIGAVLERIRHAKCDALLVLQPSLGNGQLALALSQQWSLPIILWATPERQETQTVSSC